jgi:CubicO group peptidase (beta-lactamase class C family)
MSTDQLKVATAAALRGVRADGVVVAVSVDQTRVFQSRGALDGRPVTEQTVMYGASLTKQMIGLLLAITVDVGRATPADRLTAWLPELPSWISEVRLHHLLHHTSGLPDVTAAEPGPPESNAEVLRRLQRRAAPPLRPGGSYAYNNTGYVLLAEVLSRVSGHSIAEIAQHELFRPLAMTSTRLGGHPVPLSDHPDPPGTVGDGGLWTSAVDLISWLTALNAGRPHPGALSRAETPGALSDGTPLDYAWGVRVTSTPHGRQLTHGGSWGGWLATSVRLPERQVAVGVLSVGSAEHAIGALGTDLADRVAMLRKR